MNRFAKFCLLFSFVAIVWSSGVCGCGGGGAAGTGGGGNNQNPTTPTVSVTPASSSITTAQSLGVTVAVAGTGSTPTGSVVVSSGSYTSSATTLNSGSATITIPAGSLAAGSATLTAKYTPDASSSSTYNSASGTATVTVTTPIVATTPTVTVTPASSSITTAQSLGVTVAVAGTGGTPSGSVVLSSGSYSSSATTLNSGSATITIPAGSLAAGSATLTAKYTPDASSSSVYNSASGTATVTVTTPIVATTPTVTVTPGSGSITTAQSLGVTVAVAGTGGTPTGSVVLSSGNYSSSATTLNSGSATITIPGGSLAAGSATLTAKYTPDASSSSTYNSASGTATVTVTSASTTSVSVSIDTLANRHAISPFVYGGSPSQGPAQASDLGMSLARWGGNATSDYNWQLHTYNAGADWYYEDFVMGGDEPDSVQFITDYENAGSHPLTTMPMLAWVAQSAENGSNGHWSFSVAAFGKQCSVDPYNTDAGNGLVAGGSPASCNTPVDVTTSAETSAYFPLLDSSSQPCPSGNCVYREPWAQALATAFGSGTCSVPYSQITSCHFYDMDNEMDIWSGSHRDVHPAPSGYDELASVFASEAASLKTWDPAAVRFGPVTCCWWYYWNGANSADKGNHGGVDYLPWWLNQISWMDQINGARTLDVFDIHAYPDANTSGLTTAQLQALSASIYRDFWDPTYLSTSGTVNQTWATSIQPNHAYPFRIPRMKALVNAIYPGTPLSFTEWSAAFYQESDFSTALGDADAYGVMGREGLSFASRWGAPSSGNPNYLALKLYGNYDGAHHMFGPLSVADANNGNPDLFSSFASLDSTGTVMTIMVINKDPKNTVQAAFSLNGFSPSTYVAYSISSTASSAIAAGSSTAWTATQSFAPYSITLLVVSGAETSKPASEWYLNPDDLMIPASGTAVLHPAINSGSSSVTLSSAVFDAYEGAAACSGSLALTNATITPSQPAAITVNAGSTPGFCHFTVTGNDGSATQTQGGWIVVGNPAATLTQAGNNQSGSAGAALAQSLAVSLNPGQSGGTATGAGILFTTSAGTLSNGTSSGTSVIATTNASGTATVTLTLPATKGTVTVTAQDQFALGGTTVTFTETSN
jgi:hypothetical protein